MLKGSFSNRVNRIVVFLLLFIMTLTFIYPVLFMVINSFKTRAQYEANPFNISFKLYLDNFSAMVTHFKIFNLFVNSFVVSGASVLIILLLGIFAAYSFAKIRFRGSKSLYLLITSTMFIPVQVIMVPMYVAFARIGLVNNLWSVILIYVAGGLPSAVLLLTSNFRGIPTNIIEASKIDGCKYLTTVLRIIVPMGMPGISIVVLMNFINYWNDLFTPLVLLQKNNVMTVMVALATIVQKHTNDVPFQFTGLLISAAPVMIIYLIFQKYVVKGLTVGSAH